MNKMKRGKCDTCWKSFIWACPLLLHLPINIISCSAYEPTDVYLKEQELISKFLASFDRMLDKSSYDGRGIQDGHVLYSIKYPSERIIKKERKEWEEKLKE